MRAHRGRHTQQLTPHLAPPGQHYRADCQASMRRPGRAGGATPRRFAPSPAILWCNRGLDRLAHRGNGLGTRHAREAARGSGPASRRVSRSASQSPSAAHQRAPAAISRGPSPGEQTGEGSCNNLICSKRRRPRFDWMRRVQAWKLAEDQQILAATIEPFANGANSGNVSQGLLARFGSYRAVLTADPAELMAVFGMTFEAANAIKLTQASAVRLLQNERAQRPCCPHGRNCWPT